MSPITHPCLTDIISSFNGGTSKLRICIVTPDLLGPVRNGGIGTANTFLAYELAAAGHKLSILFTQCGTTATSSGSWLADYHRRGIEVSVAEEWAGQHGRINVQPNHAPLAMAHTVYDWLAEHVFDAVMLMEWQGHGFYALQAKRAGLRFQKTAFITQIHSPSLWHAANNADLPTDPMQTLTYFMERKSVELADAVISPSAYMLDWVRRHGFNPPTLSFVQPNLLEVQKPAVNGVQAVASVDVLVFFGRLEYRKGLVQFCDALDRLARLEMSPRGVTFLGKFARVGLEHSGLYIARRAKNWNFPIKILTRFGQAEALEYLSAPGRLAVMPSVADNSPYTVYECLAAGIAFLARDVGGVAELVAAEDRAACLFNDNPNVLAHLLAKVLAEGAKIPQLAFTLAANREAWIVGLPSLVQQINQANPPKTLSKSAAMPWVSICLTHYNRPKLLRQAVASLLEQDYPNLEVILVDDGSPGNEAARELQSLEPEFAQRGWKILRLDNGYLGKARNTAVHAARGEFLLFMDDDNVARSNMVSRFVQAAMSSDADLVTTVFEVFSGDKRPTAKTTVIERFLPVGDIVSFSVVTNAIGDANSLIRRSLFEKLGGFSEDYGLGHEDFELYLRAVLRGAKVSVVPEPLFWYRRNGESMLSATHAAANRMRSFRPFLDNLPVPLVELAVLAHGLAAELMPRASADFVELDGLLPAERQCLVFGDPDASETVAAVASVLMQLGQHELAQAILEDLERAENKLGTATNGAIESTVILAAKRRDYDAIHQALVSLNVKEISPDLLVSGYRAALNALAELQDANAVVKQLAQQLVKSIPKSLPARLLGTTHLLATGATAQAIIQFASALQLGGASYCRQRPDVAEAVKCKQFSSGLHHYALHGQSEGTPWPEHKAFCSVTKNLQSALQSDAHLKISPKVKGMLLLAYEAFLIKGKIAK